MRALNLLHWVFLPLILVLSPDRTQSRSFPFTVWQHMIINSFRMNAPGKWSKEPWSCHFWFSWDVAGVTDYGGMVMKARHLLGSQPLLTHVFIISPSSLCMQQFSWNDKKNPFSLQKVVLRNKTIPIAVEQRGERKSHLCSDGNKSCGRPTQEF